MALRKMLALNIGIEYVSETRGCPLSSANLLLRQPLLFLLLHLYRMLPTKAVKPLLSSKVRDGLSHIRNDIRG